ncbi:hypothetical protein GNP82_16660 [Aliivibrio fischeri]|uniref:Ig-like domain-containing protein n=1 Tax=Aliivibrio fischeri TaxID=668 RepID=UPI0012D9D2C5|nr:Ig-like domain-containing protein [Aliivibrio fischeri]MUK39185.1 hypothetical protein [Aliivibrio fischeri]MUL04115.1 hypothetical protein [Aliivibrio fischeri]MUL06659.1 hypothetical protein [Aliivibrio fischeri]
MRDFIKSYGLFFFMAIFFISGCDSNRAPLFGNTKGYTFISPEFSNIPVGDSLVLSLIKYENGEEIDATQDADWSVSSGDSFIALNNNKVTGIEQGIARVTASYLGEKYVAIVNVTGAITSIWIEVEYPVVPVNVKQNLKVMGATESNVVVDITALSVISSNMGTDIGEQGDYKPIQAGTETITVNYKGMNDQTDIYVIDAYPVNIVTKPQELSVPLSYQFSLSATGLFSNGLEYDLTDSASWRSTSGSVEHLYGSHFLAKTIGDAELIAEFGSVNSSSTAHVKGLDEIDVSIETTPSEKSMWVDREFKLNTIAKFDKQSVDVTKFTRYLSNDLEVLSPVQSNEFVAIAEGITDVQANYQEWSNLIPVEVLSGQPEDDLTVTPGATSINKGGTGSLQAQVTFDSKSVDVTDEVKWSSEDNSTVMVSSLGGIYGVNETNPPTPVSANYADLTESSSQVTVLDGEPDYDYFISYNEGRLEPSTPYSITKGDDYQLRLVRVDNNTGIEGTITTNTWSSSNSDIRVTNGGLVTGMTSGAQGTITTSYDDVEQNKIEESVTVQVSDAIGTLTIERQSEDSTTDPIDYYVNSTDDSYVYVLKNDGVEVLRDVIWEVSSGPASITQNASSATVTPNNYGVITLTASYQGQDIDLDITSRELTELNIYIDDVKINDNDDIDLYAAKEIKVDLKAKYTTDGVSYSEEYKNIEPLFNSSSDIKYTNSEIEHSRIILPSSSDNFPWARDSYNGFLNYSFGGITQGFKAKLANGYYNGFDVVYIAYQDTEFKKVSKSSYELMSPDLSCATNEYTNNNDILVDLNTYLAGLNIGFNENMWPNDLLEYGWIMDGTIGSGLSNSAYLIDILGNSNATSSDINTHYSICKKGLN